MIKTSIPWNIKKAMKAIELGVLKFDNVIQRNAVWDRKRMSLLVDSILRDYPIPPFYLIETDKEVTNSNNISRKIFDCIDGKQRCTSMYRFRNNEFSLTGLESLNGENLNGKRYKDLSEDMKDAFDSFSLNMYLFTQTTAEEIVEMMSRLNNGKPLSSIEYARIKAKNLAAIKELAQHAVFVENLTPKQIQGYANEDIVIKTAIQFDGNFELSAKVLKQTYEAGVFDEAQIEKIKNVLDETEKVLSVMKSKAEKSVIRKTVKKTNLVAIIFFINSVMENCTTEDVADFLVYFFGAETVSISEAYNIACTNGTNHAENVKKRNSELISEFDRFMEARGEQQTF